MRYNRRNESGLYVAEAELPCDLAPRGARGFMPAFGAPFANAFANPSAVTPWYLKGGVAKANCIAAYQPKGAASLAASYVNLVNPGTYNAAPGTAPTFNAATGWTFDGTQYLTTGYNPVNGWSFLIRHSGLVHNNGVLLGTRNGSNGLFPQAVVGGIDYRTQSSDNLTAPEFAAGVLCVAGRACYRNGVADGTIPGVDGTQSTVPVYIAALNNNGSAAVIATCSVQALAIYNTTLTGPQVLAISSAMALL